MHRLIPSASAWPVALLSLISLVDLGWPRRAHADTTPSESWRALADRGQLGPLRLQSTLRIDLAYDSNVRNGGGPAAVLRINPALDLQLKKRQTELVLRYVLGSWNYLGRHISTTLNHRLQLVAALQATRRLRLELNGELIRAADPGFVTGGVTLLQPRGILDSNLVARLGYQLTRRIALSVDYAFRWTDFDSPGAPPPNPPQTQEIPPGTPRPAPQDQRPEDQPPDHSQDHRVVPGILWQTTRRHRLGLHLRIERSMITSDPDLTKSRQITVRSALIYGPEIQWSGRLTRAVSLQIAGGPLGYHARSFSTDPNPDMVVPDTTAYTWQARARLRFDHRPWRVTLTAIRDLYPNTGTSRTLWNDNVRAELDYHVPRWTVHLGLSHSTSGEAPDRQLLFRGFTAQLSVDRSLGRHLALGLFYNFRWQQGPFDNLHISDPVTVTRSVAGIRLIVRFGAAPPEKTR